VAARYRDGFSECAQEVDRFLASVSGLGHDTRYRLMNHLASCIKQQPTSTRRTGGDPPAFNTPALIPGIYAVAGVPLPPARADSTSESTVHDPITPLVDGRRRSVSVAAAPYSSAALFPGFVMPPASLTGRMSACAAVFPPLVDQQPAAAATPAGVTSSFRPIQSPPLSAVERCSPTDSEQLDHEDDDDDHCDEVLEVTQCCRDDNEDANAQPRAVAAATASSCVGGRPLAERNDNTDNIARGFLDCSQSGRDAAAPHAAVAADQSMMMYLMEQDVKDEHVWRPW